jgi:anti-sigma factor ChrR (cupin superfamily)
MPREHTEFIQAQLLPWQPMNADSPRPGAEGKSLSIDQASGASSSIIAYPGGWRMPGPHVLLCDEEFYVLRGALDINGNRYEAGDYAYLPSTYPRDSMVSRAGCEVLTFFEGPPVVRWGEAGDGGFDATSLIEHLKTAAMDWIAPSEAAIARPGVGRKVLRPDSDQGERSWIMKIEASESNPFAVNGLETHPCVEEMYLLEGSFVMPSGLMTAGAYFWRPAGIPHGPMGTKAGFLALFRCKEGAFSTRWSEPATALSWDAPYRPVLPQELRRLIGLPGQETGRQRRDIDQA